MNAKDVLAALEATADKEKAAFFPRFFKTGKGEYGYGDKFFGVTVPKIRKIVGEYRTLPLAEVKKLLNSPYHEARLTAVLILVAQYKKARTEDERKRLFDFYLAHTDRINNWDLVDSSAEHIVGAHLRDKDKSLLTDLAGSESLWERRISIMSTFHFIKHGDPSHTLKIAEMLLQDKHDLIHKAVGWMLREAGKRCSKQLLIHFLENHTLPRTALRYAIEHFPKEEREVFMKAGR